MNKFKEFQFATIIFIILIPIQLVFIGLFLTSTEFNGLPAVTSVLTNCIIVIAYLLFYGMTTTIDSKTIRISYGIGLIRKTIKLSEIRSVCVVTTPWYYGWGIRFIPNGMLYNINGISGIELSFKDRSRIIRIGSGNASALESAVHGSIKSHS